MTTQTPPTRYAGCLMLALTVAGCANPVPMRSQSGASTETVMGNYEAIAGCVAEAGAKSARGGGPALNLERSKKLATLSRGPSGNPQYQITFSQYGATTVKVEGRPLASDSDSTQAFQFLWSQVAMCAANLIAP